jgi:hypothetical protein
VPREDDKMASRYQQELEEGATKIIEKAKELAKDCEVPVKRVFWGDGAIHPNYVSQTLTIETSEDNVRGVFHEAWICGYEERCGQEKALNLLRKMLDQIERP